MFWFEVLAHKKCCWSVHALQHQATPPRVDTLGPYRYSTTLLHRLRYLVSHV